jgi:hypothetical protein
MKPLAIICCLLATLLLFSCSDESNLKEHNFSLSYSGNSPGAKVIIHNYSTAEGPVEWIFGPGANIPTSTSENPEPLIVEKAGEFFVTLNVHQGDSVKSITKSVIIPGNTVLETLADVEFVLTQGPARARSFSVRKVKMYKDVEIDRNTGKDIDMVLYSLSPSVNILASPDERKRKFYIPNGLKTIIVNNAAETGVTPGVFEQAVTDSFLPKYGLNSSDHGTFSSPGPHIILFVLPDGRKGGILTKEITESHVVADIKVQKYLP